MFNFQLRKPILHCWEDMDAFHLLDDNIVDIILKMVIIILHACMFMIMHDKVTCMHVM